MNFQVLRAMASRFQSRPSAVRRWALLSALFGVVLTYQPAVGGGTGFTLPYTDSVTNANGSAIDLTNNGTGDVSDTIDTFTAGGSDSAALYGNNFGTGYGVVGQSSNSFGMYGNSDNAIAAGLLGTNSAGGAAIIGVGSSLQSPSGYFLNTVSGNGTGLQGQCDAGNGVVGYGATGVVGITSAANGNAAVFVGNVQVTGSISGAAKHFRIDHPLDPAHKYLIHASVESNEQINTYSGNVVLDSDGKATVQLPDWFEAENADFRYALTCVGRYAPVYVETEIAHNRFQVAGGKPGLKVSWQVTATRQDAYARNHPLNVEQAKSGDDDGKYLDPEDYGKPASSGIGQLASVPQSHLKLTAETTKALRDVQIIRAATPNPAHQTVYRRAPRTLR